MSPNPETLVSQAFLWNKFLPPWNWQSTSLEHFTPLGEPLPLKGRSALEPSTVAGKSAWAGEADSQQAPRQATGKHSPGLPEDIRIPEPAGLRRRELEWGFFAFALERKNADLQVDWLYLQESVNSLFSFFLIFFPGK